MENQPAHEPTPAPRPAADPRAAAPPQRIVLEQPGGLFGRFGKVLLALLMISLLANLGQWSSYRSYFTGKQEIQERYHSLNKFGSEKVAVIRLEGVILEGDGFVKRQIDQVRQDEGVRAIVLRIDSPGGTVAGSHYLYHHLKNLAREREIPLVVSMGSLCASGGYYAAMAVGDRQDAIFAEPSTWTGSIGVIVPHYDVSGLLESWNIKDDSVMSHPYKRILSPTRSLDGEAYAEERQIIQSLVDDSFEAFKEVVRSGRPALRDNDAALDMVATGQLFTAQQALKHRLVDKIGYIEDAVDRAIDLAALQKDQVRVVQYARPAGLVDLLTSATAPRSPYGFGLDQLLDLTAPRAWYLSTWLPSVLSSPR